MNDVAKIAKIEFLNLISHEMKIYDTWIIVSHVRPDCDTLGCAAALASFGMKMGKKIRWWGKDPIPEFYGFLPCRSLYETIDDAHAARLAMGEGNALWIFLDTSNLERSVHKVKLINNDKSIVIDHHQDNTRFGDISWVEDAASTGDMIVKLLAALSQASRIDIDSGEATALYAAIATDTGFFRFASVTPDTLKAAAMCLEWGASPVTISDSLNRRLTQGTLLLWSRALAKARLDFDGKLVISYLSKEDFEDTQSGIADTEGIINTLLGVKTSFLAAFLTPISLANDDNNTRVSLRSREPVNCSLIAAHFGGGGHVLASGYTASIGANESIENLVSMLREHDTFRNITAG